MIEDGKVDFSFTDVVEIAGHDASNKIDGLDANYVYVKDGKVDGQPKDGLAANANGVWAITDKGTVDFKTTAIIPVSEDNEISDLRKAVGESIYVSKSEWMSEYEGVVKTMTGLYKLSDADAATMSKTAGDVIYIASGKFKSDASGVTSVKITSGGSPITKKVVLNKGVATINEEAESAAELAAAKTAACAAIDALLEGKSDEIKTAVASAVTDAKAAINACTDIETETTGLNAVKAAQLEAVGAAIDAAEETE